MGALFLLVLFVALICGWLIILLMSYHNALTPAGDPIAWWGRRQFRPAENLLIDTITGVHPSSPAEHLPQMGFGGALVIVLYFLCQLYPAWPLHPIGLLGAGTWCISQIWASVFVGWLIRNVLLRYGGTRAYNAAKPFFVGLLMGELFALVFWCAIAGILALRGLEYFSVNILPY